MNYSNNISALQQQMMQGAEILARESKQTKEYRSDGYVNMLNKYGTSRDSSSHYVFQADAITMDAQLTEAYEGNGLFTKIIDRPAEEAVKKGFDLGIKDHDILSFLADKLDELEWEQKASQALKWTRLYGGALMVMVINDGRNIWDPVDWQNVRGIEELRVYERPLVTPDYHSVKYGEPQFYTVSSITGTFKVHRSRTLPFRNGVLPENSLNTQYRFWGIPEYYRIKRNLQETYTAHGNGVKLLDRCVQAIYKMKNLSGLLLTDDGENQVLKRLNAIDMARGIINTMIIDADGEDYDYKQMSLSGVREIIDSTCTMLSAVTDIPQTILFGRSPAGMNSTGEGDMENFYSMVEGIQKLNLKANGRKLLDLIFHEGVVTGQLQQKPKYKTEFEKLWSLSEKEQAELDKMKADTELVKAQTAQIYVDLQVLNPEEIRAGLSKDDTFYVEDLLSDEDLDLSGVESPISALESTNVELSTDNILQAIEDGTEDTTGILPEDITATDSKPETVDDILEAIEAGTEDSSVVLMCDPEIDEIIEEIEGETENEDEEPQDLDVGVGVLVIKDGKILVAERSDEGTWCGPGGHVAVGENCIQAALRETYEEMDIACRELVPIDGFEIELDGVQQPNQFLCTVFDGDVQCTDGEMSNPQFLTLEEIQHYPLFPPFEEVLLQFLKQVAENNTVIDETEVDNLDFDESKVKRDKEGKFAEKGSSESKTTQESKKETKKGNEEIAKAKQEFAKSKKEFTAERKKLESDMKNTSRKITKLKTEKDPVKAQKLREEVDAELKSHMKRKADLDKKANSIKKQSDNIDKLIRKNKAKNSKESENPLTSLLQEIAEAGLTGVGELVEYAEKNA